MPVPSTVGSRPRNALGLEAHRLEVEFRRELRWSMLLPAAALFVAGGLLGAFALYVQRANGRIEGSVPRLALALGVGFAVLVGPALALATARRMRRSRQAYHDALVARERAARSLHEREEMLRLAKDAARMGAWSWDLVSGELTWSDRCKALFGVSPDAVMSREAFLAAVHPDDRDRIDRAVREALEHGTPYDVEMRVPWSDGSVRWIASKGQATLGADGQPVRMTGMALDITDRKRAEEALREADRRKDEFLGMLSHELRNPLAPIRSSVHILGRAEPGSEQARRARTVIGRQVDHLARLVDDLLDVKRIASGKLRVHRAPLDLTKVVRETVEDIRPLFANRSVALDLELPGEAVWVSGDRTRLVQVLGNLLHNAAKFTDVGGHVSVTVASDDRHVSIRVRDDGVGVPAEMLDTLFEPFVQADKTLHRSTGGLGLGLSLVRGITELHGGTVAARSGGAGKGAEFVVTLPTTEPELAAPADAIAPRSDAKCRVLIIEDNVDAAESLGELIQMVGGHEVHLAHDGASGVAAARQHAPDVIFCDVGLPVMDGYEVARSIRESGVAPGARLVALSGYASPDDVDRALRAGFDYHVAKPPDVDRVLALIAEAPSCRSCATLPEDLRTGHHEVDLQHASILSEVERLRSASADAAWESLRFLQQHTSSHFQYERALMEDVGFPGVATHQQHHDDFLRRLGAFRDRLERSGATRENLRALADTVQAWVIEHVLDEDRRLAEFLRGGRGRFGSPPPPRRRDPGASASRRTHAPGNDPAGPGGGP